ncbi:MAG: ribbon-helix-helix protein, CopG family [Candidatus Dormibacterales bacterium]
MTTAKIAVSLPGELVERIDRERFATHKTRSAYFREVLERHVRETGQAALVEAYIRGYQEHPEAAAEDAAAEAMAAEAWRDLEWR